MSTSNEDRARTATSNAAEALVEAVGELNRLVVACTPVASDSAWPAEALEAGEALDEAAKRVKEEVDWEASTRRRSPWLAWQRPAEAAKATTRALEASRDFWNSEEAEVILPRG